MFRNAFSPDSAGPRRALRGLGVALSFAFAAGATTFGVDAHAQQRMAASGAPQWYLGAGIGRGNVDGGLGDNYVAAAGTASTVKNDNSDTAFRGDPKLYNPEDLLVVSPDVGGVVRARALAKRLESDLAIIDKRRPKANVSEVMNIIGEVDGRTCVIMDDMVDTAGTLCKAAQALKDHGAAKVLAYCTHPVLSGSAVQRVADSVLDELVVTDTIPLSEEAKACKRIRQISIAELMAETMLRISNEESVSSLFME
mgnify:CR=1 FL=1